MLFGGLIWWADPDAGPFVALILCGVLAGCWFAMMWNTTWRSWRLRGRWLTRAVVLVFGIRTKVPGAAPSTHVVRVPVPIGGLEDARRVVAALGRTIHR